MRLGCGCVLAENQLDQLLLLPAHLRGDSVQVQVFSQVLHFELHQLGSLKQDAVKTLAGVAEPRLEVLLSGAAAAVIFLAVHAGVLQSMMGQFKARYAMSNPASQVT